MMETLFKKLSKNVPLENDLAASYWRDACFDLLEGHGRPLPTKRQAECLQIIKAYIKKNEMPPTYRDIGDPMGVAPASVSCFLQGLSERGYIAYSPGRHRSIRVIEFPSHNNA